MKATSEIERLAQRFKQYGLTADIIRSMVKSGKQAGMTEHVALIGVRLGVARTYHTNEIFTSADLAEICGCTLAEANAMIEENMPELEKNGGLVSIDARTLEIMESFRS